MKKIIISEEEMMKYPGEERPETIFLIKAYMEGQRSDATVYFDEAFIEYTTENGKDSISLSTVIDWLDRGVFAIADKISYSEERKKYMKELAEKFRSIFETGILKDLNELLRETSEAEMYEFLHSSEVPDDIKSKVWDFDNYGYFYRE